MNTGFDFLPAINRNLELRLMLRRLARTQDVTDPWESWLRSQIEASEQDIVAARNARIATASNSDYPIMQFGNILTPIVPQWANGNNLN